MLPLLLALILLIPTSVFAQGPGLFQVAPGQARDQCTDITNPVANLTWCADGNGSPNYTWKVWDGSQYITLGGGSGSTPATPDTSVQFNNSGVFGGDSHLLWNNTLKRLQVGTLPLGPLAPGPLVVGTVAPDGVGQQAGLFQTTTGTNAGEGLVTLGSDNVAVSGWAFRGADGSNPLYGGNFGVHFVGPGQVRGVEIDVQNEFADTGPNDFGHNVALWLNRSGTFNSSSAIEISSQDNRGWHFGIHFDPGGAGTGSDTLIKNWGIYAFRAMPDKYIGFVPSDDLNPDNDIITIYAFDETTKKSALNKRGQFFSRGDDTGVTQPAFTFIDEPTTGLYLAATNQLAFAVGGTEVFKALTAPTTGTLTHGYITSFGTTFASLGSVINGALIYCSDCQQTVPCLGGGSGAYAAGINAAWSCTAGGAAGAGTVTNTGALTLHAPVIGNGGVDIKTTAALTDGQLLIGSSGADPVPASVSAGTGITITPGAGTLTIDATGGTVGPGTTNTVAKFTGASTIGDSTITDDGSTVAFTLSKTWTWDGAIQTMGNACAGANTVCGLVVDAFTGAIYGGDGVSTTGGDVGTVVFGSGSAATGDPVAAFAAGLAAQVSGDHSVSFSADVSGFDSFGFRGTVSGNNAALFDLVGGTTLATNTAFQVAASVTPELTVTANTITLPFATSLQFTGNSGGAVGLTAPSVVVTPTTFKLPAADGSNGDCLVTNGTGQLTFSNTCAGGGGITNLNGLSAAVQSFAFSGGAAASFSSAVATHTFTWAGTSGGIPYFSGVAALDSSALLTNHAMMVGGGAGAAPKTLAVLTDGQLYIGSTGVDPVPASITAGSGITVTPGAGTITIAASGGTGTVTHTAGALTLHAPVIGNAGDDLKTTAAMTNGQFLIGSTGADPVPASITSSTLTTTSGAGTFAIDLPSITTGQVVVGGGGAAYTGLNVTGLVLAQGASPAIVYPGSTCPGGQFATSLNASGVVSCGTPAGAGNVSAGGTLTANQIVLGQGTTAVATLGTLGTTTTVLHGNAGGAPSFGAVNLVNDITGTLQVTHGGTGLASGTSGGVPYFSSGTTIASSTQLVNTQIVLGGGAAGPRTMPKLTNGQLPIGNTAGDPVNATLTAGTGISITNGAGSITVGINPVGGCGGGGRVSFSGSTTDVVVAFGSPMANTSYAMSAMVVPDLTGVIGIPIYVKDVTVNGFTVVMSAAPGLGKTHSLAWMATPSTCTF